MKLVDSWDEVNRQQAALALFQPGSQGLGAIEAELPLEPALASLSDSIQESLGAIGNNMEDMEQQLEQWKHQQDVQHKQQQQRGRQGAGGIFSSPRPGGGMPGSVFKAAGGPTGRSSSATSPWYSPRTVLTAAGRSPAVQAASAAGAGGGSGVSQQVELLYKVLQVQQDTEVNLRSRITGLRQQMEQLGIIKTDAEHQAGKMLGRWADAFDADGSDDEYGSEGSSDSGYERGEPGSRAAGVGSAGRFGVGAAMRSPSASAGTALRGASWASPLGRSAAGAGATPAGRTPSGVSGGFATPAPSSGSRGWQAGSPALNWVSPGATAAKTSSRVTPSRSGGAGGSSGSRRQVTPGSTSAGSSEAWCKRATELSNSTGQTPSGSGRSKVRTTYATPTSSRSSGKRSLGPDRPSSPLQIPAAAAAATGLAGGAGGAAAAGPSEPFSFSRTSQAGGPSTPAAQRAAVPGKLAFSPVAATPPAASGGAAAAAAASPALSPLWSTPVASSKRGAEGSSPLFQMQGNPLFGSSPGATPLAAVPAPSLNMAAGAGPAAAAAKPPAQPGSKGSGQPPEPPATLQQQAHARVGG